MKEGGVCNIGGGSVIVDKGVELQTPPLIGGGSIIGGKEGGVCNIGGRSVIREDGLESVIGGVVHNMNKGVESAAGRRYI